GDWRSARPNRQGPGRGREDRIVVSRDRARQPRFAERAVLWRPVRARRRQHCFLFGYVFGEAAFFPSLALQLPRLVRAQFVAVLLRSFLFLLRSVRFEVRLPFVPAPAFLERRFHFVARENWLPGRCLRVPD